MDHDSTALRSSRSQEEVAVARKKTLNGPVTTRLASQEELKRLRPRKGAGRGGVKHKRMPGDLGIVFGRESKRPMFIGGEGGRNWSVPSTLC